MGRRGPKPTPTKILKFRGSRQVETRKDEPEAETGIPRQPAWLSAAAKTEWKRIVGELDEMEILAKVDQTTLAVYCETYAEYLEARKLVQKHGMTTVTEGGTEMQHPAVGIMHRARADLKRYAALFGLSPADRAGIGIENKRKSKTGIMTRSRSKAG